MSFRQKLGLLRHRLFYFCLMRRAEIRKLGDGNSAWLLSLEGLDASSVIVSAGVGHDITFERALADLLGCRILLLDPSPTGAATMQRGENRRDAFEFLPVGLAGKSGTVNFSPPQNAEEGSFRVSDGTSEIQWSCRTLASLAEERTWASVDLLKMDIEGFEYGVLDQILDEGPGVRQICVEFHHGIVPGIRRIQTLRALWRLWRAGYRLVAHEHLNHTFVKS